MSLDVYLTTNETRKVEPKIVIRKNGQTREITRAEWDIKFPDREPFMTPAAESGEVYSNNITHNLRKMAGQAGIYKHLWRPEELDITHAHQLVKPLTEGLEELKGDPDYFTLFNPENGWGTYGGLIRFVESYLQACKDYPDATIGISR